MKILRLSLMFVALPFLAGCMSMGAVSAAKEPRSAVLPDRVHHIEMATISGDDHLLILFSGSITNSPRNSQFTLVIPLAEIKTNVIIYSARDTNGLPIAGLSIPRSEITEGWPKSLNACKPVPVGPPISPEFGVYPDGFGSPVQTAKLLPNATQTLYQVRLPHQVEFIFVDASDGRASTEIRVAPAPSAPKKHWEYYLLLPVTVPLDVATAPVQIPFIMLIAYAMGHPGC